MGQSSIKSTITSFASDPASTIYRARRARGMSAQELARRSGIHEIDIRTLERTAALPPDTELRALAKALNVSTNALLTGKFTDEGVPEIMEAPQAFIEHTKLIRKLFPLKKGER
jgi:ribosome-binding protein aMBF1 (putative translation factor)